MTTSRRMLAVPARLGHARLVAGATILALACGATTGFVTSGAGTDVVLLLPIAVASLSLLARLPLPWWPSLLLIVCALAPANYLPLPTVGLNGSVSPTLFLFLGWLLVLVRRPSSVSRLRVYVGLSAVPLCLAMAASAALNGASGGGLLWAVNLVLMVFVFAILTDAEAAGLLSRVVVRLGAVLGVYAVVEAHVLHANPLWSWASGGDVRASASFGHPLYAASFFALATTVAVHRLTTRPTAQAALVAAACGAGLASAGSRGALIASLVGIVGFATAIVLGRAGSRRQLRPLGVIAVMFGAVVAAGVAQRSAAGEVDGSNEVRSRSLATGLYLAGRAGLLGSGPGSAYVVKVNTPGPGTDEKRSIENSWIELYVALGPMGTAAFALPVAVLLLVGVAYRRWLGVAALSALLVAFTFYNALEGGKPLTMLLLGAAASWCLPPTLEGAAPVPREGREAGGSLRRPALL